MATCLHVLLFSRYYIISLDLDRLIEEEMMILSRCLEYVAETQTVDSVESTDNLMSYQEVADTSILLHSIIIGNETRMIVLLFYTIWSLNSFFIPLGKALSAKSQTPVFIVVKPYWH